jgi:UDP-N-acetylglucosamine acyltransferase
MSEIDPRAIVSKSARLGEGVKVGPYAIVGDEVELGDGCILHENAVVRGPSRLGRENRVFSFAVVGGDPQDLSFKGERVTLEVGDANQFREFSTINRGTVKGGGATKVGSHNLFMSYTHVGHDSIVGSHTIFVNGATLAGHVIVDDYATVGNFSPVHQFCRVGRYAYIGAHTVITQDVPPFSKVVTPRHTACYGINNVGLQRHGFSPERLKTLEKAYRFLVRSKLNTSQAIAKMRETMPDSEDVKELIAFIETAERGLTK